jgi:hypothetical protein
MGIQASAPLQLAGRMAGLQRQALTPPAALRARQVPTAHSPWTARAVQSVVRKTYFASPNSGEGTQPSLPSSSLTFHQILSFSPVG